MSKIVTVTGCATNTNEKKSKAETLLESKYGEKFTVIEYDGSEPMENWYTVRAYSEKEPDIVFKAEIDSNGMVSDTYVQRRVGCALRDQIENALKDLDGGFVVYAAPTTYYTVSTDPDITPEKFNGENPTNEYYICLYLDKEVYSGEQAYEFAEKVLNEIGDFSGYIEVVITDAEKLSKVDTYFTEQDDIYSELNDMLSGAERADIRYENGKVVTDCEEFVGGLK